MSRTLRADVYDALMQIPEVKSVTHRWPETEVDEPTLVYGRTAGNQDTYGSEEGYMDEYVQFTIHIIATSYSESERIAASVKKNMNELGYRLAMESNPEGSRITVIYDMTLDINTNYAHRGGN